MRKAVTLALAAALAGTIASAQYKRPAAQPPAKAAPTPLKVAGTTKGGDPQFPRISQEDAFELYESDKAIFIDVRSNGQYKLGHIEGALSIPGSQIVRRFAEVPHGKAIITYCACSAEQSSGRAVAELIAHGVRNVFALKGGIKEWQSSRKPIAKGPEEKKKAAP